MLIAGERLADAYERVDENNSDDAIEEWQRSIRYATRALDSIGREVMRPAEDVVYKRVMTKTSPFYFDNELIYSILQWGDRLDGGAYVFEVNIADDELKPVVSDFLRQNETSWDQSRESAVVGVKTNCPCCGHRWVYEGESISYTTCPDCGRSVRIKR